MADGDVRICGACGAAFMEGQRTLQPVRCPECGVVVDDAGKETDNE